DGVVADGSEAEVVARFPQRLIQRQVLGRRHIGFVAQFAGNRQPPDSRAEQSDVHHATTHELERFVRDVAVGDTRKDLAGFRAEYAESTDDIGQILNVNTLRG